ncbi:MAG: SurA N-terminal domain-containing protein [Paracoccaceae bacterium]
MAKGTDSEAPRKRGQAAQIAVYGLLALLVLGLGGFGVDNFGGRVAHIGTVGDRDITAQEYDRALRQQQEALTQQLGMVPTPEVLAMLGIDPQQLRQQLLQSLISRAALDNEAANIGLSVGDDSLRQLIQQDVDFHAGTGGFNPETYRAVLQQRGQSVEQYEDEMRRTRAANLLYVAIVTGFAAPDVLTETLYQWVGERRGFTLFRLTETNLTTPLAEPTPADLQAHYDANIARFTKPEAKRITYVALLPEMIADSIAIDETALRAEYDKRIAEFVQPERRLVERLPFPDEAAATEAKARIDAGGTFEQEVAKRAVRLEDLDLGDVTPADLGAAGDAVFALTEPGVVGPFPTDFGPALFRMNAVLAAQETSFDEAREQLAGEAQMEAARREIAGRAESINDALAGGATLAELAEQEALQIGTFDYVPRSQNDEPIAGYEDFRIAADEVTADSFAEAFSLDDGGLAALQLDEIVPPAPIPFAEVEADVTTAWRAEALAKALSARAIEVKSEIEGGADIGSFGIVSVTPEITRERTIEDVPASVIKAVFELQAGQQRIIEEGDFVGIIQLDAVIPAETEGVEADAIRQSIATQTESGIAQDAFEAFSAALSASAGVQLDAAAVEAVEAQFN